MKSWSCYFCGENTDNTNPSDNEGHVLCAKCKEEIERDIEKFEQSSHFLALSTPSD